MKLFLLIVSVNTKTTHKNLLKNSFIYFLAILKYATYFTRTYKIIKKYFLIFPSICNDFYT